MYGHTEPVGTAARPHGLSPVQRQLAWLLLPVGAGIISAVHFLTDGPHPSRGRWAVAGRRSPVPRNIVATTVLVLRSAP